MQWDELCIGRINSRTKSGFSIAVCNCCKQRNKKRERTPMQVTLIEITSGRRKNREGGKVGS